MPAKDSQWWSHSWNPIRYLDGWMCTKISPGCLHCYAEGINGRFGNGLKYPRAAQEDFKPTAWRPAWRLDEDILAKPLHWRKPRRIFVMDMGDLFHEQIPFEWVDAIMAIIALCPQHRFLILTKRSERMNDYFGKEYQQTRRDNVDKQMQIIKRNPYLFIQDVCGGGLTLPNLSLGVTVESGKYLWRINELIQDVPAAHKFVSLEPLLEEIHIGDYLKHLDWVVVGPETGPRRRPCEIKWLESIVDQCDAANVPVWVKTVRVGSRISHDPAEWPEKLRRRELPI